MRRGEILGLEWGDVEVDSPTPSLTVRRSLARTHDGYGLAETKTSRSRRTLELAAAALRVQRDRQADLRRINGDLVQNVDDLVFTGELGRPIHPAWVSHRFSDLLARLGLPHVHLHDLRHGVASILLAQGVPLKVIIRTLGHSGITITADLYTHLDREQRRVAASAIERALGGM